MWRKWFSTYRIPKLVDDLVKAGVLIDRTREIDVTPHFEAELPGATIVLWVDHPNPESRYLPGGPRYMVNTYPSRQTLLETDSLEEAVLLIAQLLSEGKGLRLL